MTPITHFRAQVAREISACDPLAMLTTTTGSSDCDAASTVTMLAKRRDCEQPEPSQDEDPDTIMLHSVLWA